MAYVPYNGYIAYYMMLGTNPPSPSPIGPTESRQFCGSDGEFMDIVSEQLYEKEL